MEDPLLKGCGYRRMTRMLAVVLAASTALAADNPTVDSACGAAGAKFDVHLVQYPSVPPKPQADSALVYVIQVQAVPVCLVGCIETARIGLDGKWLGANRFDSWLYFQIKPGEHHLCAALQGKKGGLADPNRISLTGLTAEAGAAYYFIARVTHTAYLGPSIDLHLANRDEGAFLVRSYYPSSSQPKH